MKNKKQQSLERRTGRGAYSTVAFDPIWLAVCSTLTEWTMTEETTNENLRRIDKYLRETRYYDTTRLWQALNLLTPLRQKAKGTPSYDLLSTFVIGIQKEYHENIGLGGKPKPFDEQNVLLRWHALSSELRAAIMLRLVQRTDPKSREFIQIVGGA